MHAQFNRFRNPKGKSKSKPVTHRHISLCNRTNSKRRQEFENLKSAKLEELSKNKSLDEVLEINLDLKVIREHIRKKHSLLRSTVRKSTLRRQTVRKTSQIESMNLTSQLTSKRNSHCQNSPLKS